MESPFESPEHREAFARYGRVHYAIQILEYELVNTFSVVSLLPERRTTEDKAWEGRLDAFFDTGFTHTFGTMLKKIGKTGLLPDKLMTRLETCKEERDFLVHRFFRYYLEDHPREEALETVMIARCDKAYDDFMALNYDLEAFSHRAAEKYGLTPQMIADEIEADRTKRPAGDGG